MKKKKINRCVFQGMLQLAAFRKNIVSLIITPKLLKASY